MFALQSNPPAPFGKGGSETCTPRYCYKHRAVVVKVGEHRVFNPSKLMDMMKQATEMQTKIREGLEARTVEGTAGGGMVKVVMNGQFEIKELRLEDSLIDMKDKGFMEDLIKSAVNDAVLQARELMVSEMKTLASGFGL